MNKLGDNPENGLVLLGGLGLAAFEVQRTQARTKAEGTARGRISPLGPRVTAATGLRSAGTGTRTRTKQVER